MSFITREYTKELDSFKKNLVKFFIGLTIGFIAFWIAGAISTYYLLKQNPQFYYTIIEAINDIFSSIGDIESMSSIQVSMAIFFNNAKASLFTIGYGVFPFLCISAFIVIFNGLLVGAVSGLILVTGQTTIVGIIAGILPHGIIEIPALAYAGAIGLYVCISISKKIISNKNNFSIKEVFINAIRGYVLIVIPLMILAAIIEGFITPLIMAIFA